MLADDLDRALELDLLAYTGCAVCRQTRVDGIPIADTLAAARDARLSALAARERYRARNARLERRAQQRAAQRVAVPPIADDPAKPAPKPPLPSAAAAVLARAKAKAAERTKP